LLARIVVANRTAATSPPSFGLDLQQHVMGMQW
jgi:hypothetical protein